MIPLRRIALSLSLSLCLPFPPFSLSRSLTVLILVPAPAVEQRRVGSRRFSSWNAITELRAAFYRERSRDRTRNEEKERFRSRPAINGVRFAEFSVFNALITTVVAEVSEPLGGDYDM